MMGMIARKGHYISWVGSTSSVDWDDPYDYFQFMRDQSTNDDNDDGYGVAYYPEDGSFSFNESDYNDPNNQVWYKTNRDNTLNFDWHDDWSWYGDTNSHYQWGTNYEPLDEIIEPTIMNNSTQASIVLGHDRNTTGTTRGNHPFRINYINPITLEEKELHIYA